MVVHGSEVKRRDARTLDEVSGRDALGGMGGSEI